MAENKVNYYTPEISELFVGYELQLQNIENALWGKYTVKQSDIFKEILEAKNWEGVRTKYLDKEGIEKDLEMSKICFIFDDNTKILTLFNNKENLFKGVCKSKNELRKILEFIR